MRFHIGDDPTVARWLQGQKNRTRSINMLIKAFVYNNGVKDVAQMSFEELLGSLPSGEKPEEVPAETVSEKEEVFSQQKKEEKVGEENSFLKSLL